VKVLMAHTEVESNPDIKQYVDQFDEMFQDHPKLVMDLLAPAVDRILTEYPTLLTSPETLNKHTLTSLLLTVAIGLVVVCALRANALKKGNDERLPPSAAELPVREEIQL
jgi:hypothetical protein